MSFQVVVAAAASQVERVSETDDAMISLRNTLPKRISDRIPLLAEPTDQHTFDVESAPLGFTTRLRFTNDVVENGYVAFTQDKTYYIVALVQFGIWGLMVYYNATTGLVSGDGLGKGGGAAQLADSVLCLSFIVFLIFQKTRKFVSPKAIERAWVFCCFTCWVFFQTGARSRQLRYCGIEAQLRHGVHDPIHCDWFHDAYGYAAWLAFVVASPRTMHVVWSMVAAILIYFIWLWSFNGGFVLHVLDLPYLFVTAMVAALLHGNELNNRTRYIQAQTLLVKLAKTQHARDEVNGMLGGMLATSVVDRLVKGEVIADSRDATVLYGDVAGFTNWSSARAPLDVLRMLNTMYQLFDMHVVPYGVEKITTIGDAYWAAANIPTPMENHADRVTAFAMCMQQQVREMHSAAAQFADIHIRIGVHSGDVSGGIAGSQQIAYQIFGDTTEEAELLEQLAPVGQVLVSEAVVQRMSDGRHTLVAGQKIERGDGKAPIRTFVVHAFDWLPPNFEATERLARDTDSQTSHVTAQSTTHDTACITTDNDVKMSQRRRLLLQRAKANPLDFVEEAVEMESDTGAEEMSGEGKLSAIKKQLSTPKYRWVLQTFADAASETEFVGFAKTLFSRTTRRAHAAMAAFFFLNTVLLIAEQTQGQSPAAYIIYVLITLSSSLIAALSPRLSAWVSFAHFYIVIILQWIAFGVSKPSFISAIPQWLVFTSVIFTSAQWSPGLSFLITALLNFAVISAPVFVIGGATTADLIESVIVGIGLLFLVVGYRHERLARQQFIDVRVARLADEEVALEHENTTALLQRTIPAFVLPQVLEWMASDRTSLIAHAYPKGATLFCRVPHLAHALHGSDPLDIMNAVAAVVSVYDASIATQKRCVKVKTIGDIVLVAAGLDAELKRASAVDVAQFGNTTPVEYQEELEASYVELAQLALTLHVMVPNATRRLAAAQPPQRDDHPPDRRSAALVMLDCDPSDRGEESRCRHGHDELAMPASAQTGHIAGATTAGLPCVVGLHCGPLMGGVLGDERLIYDVFGDVVNTTSRIMSTSGGKGVWASQAFFMALGESAQRFKWGLPVARQMKGKGEFFVYELDS